MPPSGLRLHISIALAKGAYTTELLVGSEKASVHALLDTGSATFAVKQRRYRAQKDKDLKPTPYVQDVVYGEGAWVGPLIKTQVMVDDHRSRIVIPDAPLALMEVDAENMYEADGILGLAYHVLNHAYDMTPHFVEIKHVPAFTYPWCFDVESNVKSIRNFRDWLQKQPRVEVEPLFTRAETRGLLANRFALLTRRAIVHVGDGCDEQMILDDPLNQGVLVFGGGESHTDLYHGAFQSIKILHDKYYNTKLKSVQVKGCDPISADIKSTDDSNSFVDTGSSFIVLAKPIYERVMGDLGKIDPEFCTIISKFQEQFKKSLGVPVESLDLDQWPSIFFVFEGEDGNDMSLEVEANAYWQMNALVHGQAFFMLMNALPSWPDQSILGLPLINGRYCVFDRDLDGTGVIKVAPGVFGSDV